VRSPAPRARRARRQHLGASAGGAPPFVCAAGARVRAGRRLIGRGG
jgi:hypothetical protein